jgi:hypothetical protein
LVGRAWLCVTRLCVVHSLSIMFRHDKAHQQALIALGADEIEWDRLFGLPLHLFNGDLCPAAHHRAALCSLAPASELLALVCSVEESSDATWRSH